MNAMHMTAPAHKNVVTRRSAVIWSLGVVAFGGLAATTEAHAISSAEAFVQSNIDRSYAILNDAALDASERKLRFRALLVSMVDVRRVASFTLGPYTRGAEQGAVDQFEAAFTGLLSAVYLRGLNSYSGLMVTGSTERAPDDVIVTVAAERTSGTSPPVSIAFRVRRLNDGKQVITDLQIEGAWLALVQRAEFMAYLQQHRGDITALSLDVERTAVRLHQTHQGDAHRQR
jgi:phospholipid transport system substrate-binding protein